MALALLWLNASGLAVKEGSKAKSTRGRAHKPFLIDSSFLL
jgi:hypothetical protein